MFKSALLGTSVASGTNAHNAHNTNPPKPTKPVTSVNGLKIVMILDESGSMNGIRNDMIGSINKFISTQKEIKNDIDGIEPHFTLVKFNSKITRVYENTPLSKIITFSQSDYSPDGSTALYDAIGDTINWFTYETNVLMVIITDGEENASQHFNHAQITKMIEEKKEYRNWSYVYLANDISVSKQGTSMGLENSKYSSNVTRESRYYGDFVGNELNMAVQQQRQKGISVQSQLNSSK